MPEQPPRPTFVEASDNSIKIQLYPAPFNGGIYIERYTLEMDQGTYGSDFQVLDSYDQTSFLMEHTATYATDGIETGKLYSFRFKASNAKGDSEYSAILTVACSSPPEQADMPAVDYSLSSRTSIFLKWQLNADGIGPGGLISGYKLYMDDGYGGDFELVMNTVGFTSQINEFLAMNLTASLQYRFQLEAYNYNELAPGPKS